MKIMVAVPIHRSVDYDSFISFIKLLSFKGEHSYQISVMSHSLIYDSREKMAEIFLKSDCDSMMFIDSDMTFEAKDIEKLASYDVPFVTAMAFKRMPPFQPCFYTKLEYDAGHPKLEVPVDYSQGLLEIEGAGMACALIKREVFENIKKPYFFPLVNLGEDLTFCLKLKEAGIKMYCDTTLSFGHLATTEITEKNFKEYYKKCLEEGKNVERLYS